MGEITVENVQDFGFSLLACAYACFVQLLKPEH